MTKLKFITSASNEQYRELLKLVTPHGLKKSDSYLLSGSKILKELQRSQPEIIQYAIYPNEQLHAIWQTPGLVLTAELFARLDIMGTGGPLMVVHKQKWESWNDSPPMGLEIFCPLGDPKNVGALLRSALGFGASSVVMLKESASPYLPEALRAGAGSHFHLKLMKGPSLSELRGDFVTLDGTAERDLSQWTWPRNVRLLIGEEGRGLTQAKQISAEAVKITVAEKLESLNASVAASLAMFSYRQAFPLIRD